MARLEPHFSVLSWLGNMDEAGLHLPQARPASPLWGFWYVLASSSLGHGLFKRLINACHSRDEIFGVLEIVETSLGEAGCLS